MYTIRTTEGFKADLRHCKRQGKDLAIFREALILLSENGCLPDAYSPHMLRDEYSGCWECHLEEDWLLIWRQNDKQLTLLLTNTGTHDELFKKI